MCMPGACSGPFRSGAGATSWGLLVLRPAGSQAVALLYIGCVHGQIQSARDTPPGGSLGDMHGIWSVKSVAQVARVRQINWLGWLSAMRCGPVLWCKAPFAGSCRAYSHCPSIQSLPCVISDLLPL